MKSDKLIEGRLFVNSVGSNMTPSNVEQGRMKKP